MEKKQKVIEYHTYDEVPLMMSAKDIARLLKISSATAYFMFHAIDFPTVTIGKRMLVRKEKFFAWLEKHENDIPYLMQANAADRRKEIMGDVRLEKGGKKTNGR